MPLLRIFAVALAYFAAARLGYAFAVGSGTVTLWPPSGVTLALLLLSPRTRWLEVVAGAVAGSIASDLLSQYSVPLAAFAAAANVGESIAAALFLHWWVGRDVALSTVRGVLGLTIGAVGIVNAVTAVVGAGVLVFGFGMPFGRAWFNWWVGDGLGMLIVGPLLLTLAHALLERPRIHAGRALEAVALFVCLAAAAIIALGPQPLGSVQPGPYFVFPFLFWAALRFGPSGAATSTMVLAAIAISFASQGVGPFSVHLLGSASATLQVYAYLAVAGVSSLIAAAALEERRTAIKEVRESRQRYQNMVDTATDAVITIDRDSRILFANRATERIFGYRPEEIVGHQLSRLMPPSVRDAHHEGLARYLSTGERRMPWQGAALIGLHKNGREVPLEVSFGEYAAGGTHEFTGILRDVSEKRAAESTMRALEEQYRQSQKMEAIGRLAGGIAHDFNNLLTVIQGNCDLLRESIPADSGQAADLEHIRYAADRASKLTRQLLTFSRQQVLAPRPVDLAARLTSLVPMLRRLIGEHISILVDARPVSPVLVDPSQFELVILNLAVNARDAMPDGGMLRLQTDEIVVAPDTAVAREIGPGRYVTLTVTDTGSGMDEETRQRVFEPFFTTKPIGSGTGLGLATVHGVVKQSGGGIEIESTIGAGTTFKVYFPRLEAEGVEPDGEIGEDPGAVQAGTILLVEDEEPVARISRRVLGEAGYRLIYAPTPDEALQVDLTTIDLLITDVVLPQMSGPALAQRLTEKRPGLRVLFMSGYSNDELGSQMTLGPGKAFLQKPFSRRDLLGRVAELLAEA